MFLKGCNVYWIFFLWGETWQLGVAKYSSISDSAKLTISSVNPVTSIQGWKAGNFTVSPYHLCVFPSVSLTLHRLLQIHNQELLFKCNQSKHLFSPSENLFLYWTQIGIPFDLGSANQVNSQQCLPIGYSLVSLHRNTAEIVLFPSSLLLY